MYSLPAGPAIIYDGDCPFCSNYATLYRAKRTLGELQLIDARAHADIAQTLIEAGYDLDKGFVFLVDGKVHYGDAALSALARVGETGDVFNWLNTRVFASERIARLCYPVLRAMRNLALFVLGRRQIGARERGTQ